jgi:cysteine-rich repeat protein
VPACGDAIVDPGEQCDDGNGTAGDGCRADCTIEACGDARLDPDEACDDGNLTSGDGCRADCTIEACGDGRRDAGEACDDGNDIAGDGCRADCSVEVCGDGRRDPGEACDDGDTSGGDGCRADCTIEACGDGRLDPGEACDDGDTQSGDGCDASCRVEQAPACGDGRLDTGEQCDDGNTAGGDGCDATCRIESAGPLVPYRVNVGGPDYTDPAAQAWGQDAPYTSDGTKATFETQIRDTNADPLYQSRRYGVAGGPPVTFTLPVDGPDLYTVRFHFAEVGNEATRSGQRVFDVVAEDAVAIKNLDVFASVRSSRALVRDLNVYVADGVLTVRLVPKVGRPMLSGIEVHREGEVEALPAPKEPKIVGCGRACR